MFGILKNAIESKAPIEMIYMSADNKLSQRIITVYEVNEHHIKAFCHLRKRTRIFKIDNILSVLPYRQKKKHVS